MFLVSQDKRVVTKASTIVQANSQLNNRFLLILAQKKQYANQEHSDWLQEMEDEKNFSKETKK